MKKYRMHSQKKILITTAIAYPNAEPHIGFASEVILGDFLARAFKKFNYDVFFSTGTDENCEKIHKTALANHQTTKEFSDRIVENFKEVMNMMHIQYNRFIRTTDQDHYQNVQHFWQQLKQNGFIYKGEYSGYYSITEEAFFAEEDLINGKTPSGNEVYWKSEPAYFLKISAFEQEIMNFLNNHNNFTIPRNKINELKGFVKNGLKDLCISRKNSGWGISVPDDQDFVIYVWFDALINYLTVVNYPDINQYWDGMVVHIIGKDIAIFHGVYWPIMLMAHKNIKIIDHLLIRNWWLFENEKMSKSKGNVVGPRDLINRFGVAPFRFYCIKNNLITNDSSVNNQKLVDDFNSFVVGKFSNLVFRVWNILDKNNIDHTSLETNVIYPEEKLLQNHIENLDITEFINILFFWCDKLNQQIDQQKAWENIPLACDIFTEIYKIIFYFESIFPEIGNALKHNRKPIIFFKKIEV